MSTHQQVEHETSSTFHFKIKLLTVQTLNKKRPLEILNLFPTDCPRLNDISIYLIFEPYE